MKEIPYICEHFGQMLRSVVRNFNTSNAGSLPDYGDVYKQQFLRNMLDLCLYYILKEQISDKSISILHNDFLHIFFFCGIKNDIAKIASGSLLSKDMFNSCFKS